VLSFFKIFNISLFYKPVKSKILIYDFYSLRFAKKLFKNKKFSVFHTRYDGLSLYILFLTIIKNGFNNFFANYKKNYFFYVQPKIIYTSIDNNPGFYKLKKLYPYAIYVADQNGMRNNIFYNIVKLLKKKKYKFLVDIMFCFGENEKKRLNKIISGNIYPLGNTLNNSRKYSKIKKFKFKNLIFISSLNIKNSKKELKTFLNLAKICYQKKLNLFFLDRRNLNLKKYLDEKVKKYKFLYLKNENYNVEKFKDRSLFLFSHSTLGYEYLSKGYRVGSFAHNYLKHFINGNYEKNGPFWINNNKIDSLNKLINKISKYNYKQWSLITKKYSNQLLKYDKDNLTKIKLINRFLK